MTTAEYRENGSWPLLKKGKTTQNEKQKNQEKFKSIGMVDQKVFRPDGSKFGLSFELALLLHSFLASFFVQTDKLGSQISQNIRPL